MPILRGYSVPVAVFHAGTPALGTVVWALRNLNGITVGTVPKSLFLRKLLLNTSFSGVAAATLQFFNLHRIRAATPTGGTAIIPVKRLSSNPSPSQVDCRQTDAGLVVAGVTVDTIPFQSMLSPRQNGASTQNADDWQVPPDEDAEGFEIPSGDGIAIVLFAAAVAGDAISGFIEYDEQPTRGHF
jgi:hypothetical protein